MIQEPLMLPRGAIISGAQGKQYIVEELLGKGGFSAVYLVRDNEQRSKMFALKEMVHPGRLERSHLTFEAQLLMKLKHDSLPSVYSIFENQQLQRIYMVMDYVAGKNIESLITDRHNKPLPLDQALSLMAPAIDAVSYLHNQNPPIVHRDIKPANIVFSSSTGKTVLVDFGLAKEYIEGKTTAMVRYGTPGYAAPEQYGQGTSPRTDIYALAATFYTLITGTVPADALVRSINNQENDPLQPVHQLNPLISIKVSRVIEQAMSLRSMARYPTVENFWQELNEAASQILPDQTPALSLSKSQSKPQNGQSASGTPSKTPTVTTSQTAIQKSKLVLLTVMALIVIGLSGGGALLIQKVLVDNARQPGTQVKAQQSATSTPEATPTLLEVKDCSAFEAYRPVRPISPQYMQMSSAYIGTISNNITAASSGDSHTDTLCLIDVQQTGNQISGRFSGLGFISTFQGTITVKTIQFKVIIENNRVFDFYGDLRSSEDFGGSYQVLNDQGQSTGETGIWAVLAYRQKKS